MDTHPIYFLTDDMRETLLLVVFLPDNPVDRLEDARLGSGAKYLPGRFEHVTSPRSNIGAGWAYRRSKNPRNGALDVDSIDKTSSSSRENSEICGPALFICLDPYCRSSFLCSMESHILMVASPTTSGQDRFASGPVA